jgi:hypothetical protein
LGEEVRGPHLRGCFRGDRVAVCVRPEELIVRTQPGDNRIRGELRHTVERPQAVRADFGHELIVDIPRDTWRSLADTGNRTGWWVEIPPESLRQLGAARLPPNR